MHLHPRKVSGFTLIELMIVVILIGIFSGLILTEMGGTFEDALLRSTARKIVSAVNLASSQAVTVNREHALWISPTESRLKVQMEKESEALEDVELDSRISIVLRESSASVSDDEEQDRPQPPARHLEKIAFLPDGTADSREIVLRDRLGVELVLQISPVTGRVRMLESEAVK